MDSRHSFISHSIDGDGYFCHQREYESDVHESACDQTSLWSVEASINDVTFNDVTITETSELDVAMTSLLNVSSLESPTELRDGSYHDNQYHHGNQTTTTNSSSIALSEIDYSNSILMTSQRMYGNNVSGNTSCWLSDADYSKSITSRNNISLHSNKDFNHLGYKNKSVLSNNISLHSNRGQKLHHRLLDVSYRSVQLSESYYTPPSAQPSTKHQRRRPELGVSALALRHATHQPSNSNSTHHGYQPSVSAYPYSQIPQHGAAPPPTQVQGIKRKVMSNEHNNSDSSSYEDSRVQGLSAITDSSLTQHRGSSTGAGDERGPLNSSLKYPRNSTPERRRTFKHTRHECKCNRKLMFGSEENVRDQGSLSSKNTSPASSTSSRTQDNTSSTRSKTSSSSLGSGSSLYDSTMCFNPFELSEIPYRGRDYSQSVSSEYLYPPHKIRHLDNHHAGSRHNTHAHKSIIDPANQSAVTTDSDASGFIYVPMAPRPVTFKPKVKVNRRKVISQQLKTIGRRIKKHGTKSLNVNTLAVL